MKIENENSN